MWEGKLFKFLGTVLIEYNIIKIDIAQRNLLPNKTSNGFKNQTEHAELKM